MRDGEFVLGNRIWMDSYDGWIDFVKKKKTTYDFNADFCVPVQIIAGQSTEALVSMVNQSAEVLVSLFSKSPKSNYIHILIK